MVVHRHNLRSTIGSLAAILTRAEAPSEFAGATPPASTGVSMRDVVVAAESDDDLAVAPPAVHAE
jgi:acetyl-CoA carboxylase carboxyl transferase subunit beta